MIARSQARRNDLVVTCYPHPFTHLYPIDHNGIMFSPREIPLPTSPLSPGSRRSSSVTSTSSSFHRLPPPELSPRSLFRPKLDRSGTSHTLKADSRHDASPPDPFREGATISVNQPVGSLSISPSSRDVCLASRKGLYILDLANLNNAPRFIPQGGTWQIAEYVLAPLFKVLKADEVVVNGHLIQLHQTTSSRPRLKNYSSGT